MKTTAVLGGMLTVLMAGLSPIHAQVPFTNSLVAYYPFDGNANDATGNGNNGQIIGNVAPCTDRFGNPASAYAFDGVSSSAIEVTNTLFNIGQAGYTVSGWLASSNVNLSTIQDVIQTVPQAGMGIAFSPNWPGALYFAVGPTHSWTDLGIVGNLLCTNQVWYQFVLVKSGTLYTLYIDGQVSVQDSISAATGYNAEVGCIIGSITPINPPYHETFMGQLDDFRIYNRALSTNEVQELYDYESAPLNTPPSITAQPQSQNVGAGQAATLSVSASGTPPFSYQWSFDGAGIEGATNSTLTVTNFQTGEAGNYSVTVSNLFGSATSSNAVLTLIYLQVPFTNNLVAYYPFDGNANDATGNGHNGVIIGNVTPGPDRFGMPNSAYQFDGATSCGIEITNTLFNIGQPGYSITGWFCSTNVTSSQIQILFNTIPETGMGIAYTHPHVNFGVGAANGAWTDDDEYGSRTNYQNGTWYQFAFIKSSNTYSTYIDGILDHQATIAAASNYNASVEGIIGSITPINPPYLQTFIGELDDFRIYNCALSSSEIQQLYAYESEPISTAPYITAQPQSQSVLAGQTATLSVGAGGTPPLSYQWSFDGAAMDGATNSTLALTNFQASGAGTYSVTVSNLFGLTASSNAILTLVSSPVITASPSNQVVAAGTPVTFSAAAAGTAPLAYQWQFNGVNISGATNTSLLLPNALLANAGSYCMVVTNLYGSATSSVATLTVIESTVQVVSTSVAGGGTVVVSIDLNAVGTEVAVGLTLNYNPSLLTFQGAVLGNGALGGAFQVNTNQLSAGSVGLGVDLFSGTFATGTNDVFDVTFQANVATNAETAAISFGNSPTAEEVANAQAQSLPAVYLPGTVAISASALEGDISPRPNGNETLNISDWVQEGRFVAGLDIVSNGSEFQRADCAPRSTLGDGQLTVADWVQAGRYAVGLDPITAAGGPTSPITSNFYPVKLGLSRPITLAPLTQGGLTNSVAVTMVAQGNENALGFSLSFNPAMIQFLSATLGSNATTAALVQNTQQAGGGRLGFLLALNPGVNFPAGTLQLLKLNFSSVLYSNNAALTFGSSPVVPQLADASANILPANFNNAQLSVGGAAWPQLAIGQQDPNNIVLTWPASAYALSLQVGATPTGPWSNVSAVAATNGSNLLLTYPISTNTEFFRLKY
jgi:hypothetical protein